MGSAVPYCCCCVELRWACLGLILNLKVGLLLLLMQRGTHFWAWIHECQLSNANGLAEIAVHAAGTMEKLRMLLFDTYQRGHELVNIKQISKHSATPETKSLYMWRNIRTTTTPTPHVTVDVPYSYTGLSKELGSWSSKQTHAHLTKRSMDSQTSIKRDHRPSNSLRWSSSVSWCLIFASFLSETQYSAGLILRLYVDAMAMQ